jgi:hypothetical protein
VDLGRIDMQLVGHLCRLALYLILISEMGAHRYARHEGLSVFRSEGASACGIPEKLKFTRAEKHYTWRGFRQIHGIRSKTKRVLTQFSPHDFTAFHWHGTASLLHYVTVVMLLAVFLAAELNPFYLKVSVVSTYPVHFTRLNIKLYRFQSLLWMEPDHPFVIARLAGVFLCALPAVRELYQYINDPRYGTGISLFTVLCFFSLSRRLSRLTFFSRSCALVGKH